MCTKGKYRFAENTEADASLTQINQESTLKLDANEAEDAPFQEKLQCMLLSNLEFRLTSSLLRVFETKPQIERPRQTEAP